MIDGAPVKPSHKIKMCPQVKAAKAKTKSTMNVRRVRHESLHEQNNRHDHRQMVGNLERAAEEHYSEPPKSSVKLLEHHDRPKLSILAKRTARTRGDVVKSSPRLASAITGSIPMMMDIPIEFDKHSCEQDSDA